MRRLLLAFSLALISSVAAAAPDQAKLKAELASARQRLEVPGIELAVWKDGKVVVRLADGVRASGSGTAVLPNDAFHIGSITKSLTSALAGTLVEQGKLRWNSTVEEVLGQLVPTMRPDYAQVTLEDLLAHEGGIPQRIDPAQLPAIASANGPKAQHMAAATAALSLPPAVPPRTAMLYSNPGYVIAAAMMEQVTGKSWEDMVEEDVLSPLHLTSAGFGPPLDGVRGHAVAAGGELVGLDPAAPQSDNPPFLNPAGRMHLNMADLASFGGDQVDGLLGMPGLLKPGTYRRIHTERLRHMELGWGGGPAGAFDNSGSNGHWLAYVRGEPARRLVIAIAINAVRNPDGDEDMLGSLADKVETLVD
jgi:CubicO group peptidase (beta-lactamase class C family)